ncbi:MAG: hypothetical protein WCE62_17155 [Polyangiales bacterium]
MSTQIRDPQFASQVNEIANAIHWPEGSFSLNPLELAVGVAIAFYDAFATPDPVILQHALKGIAF